jgi:methylthioribose-1-phosphate isomerase
VIDRPIVPIAWRDGAIEILDQRALPFEETTLECRTLEDVCSATCELAIRGAPVLGITAGLALALVATTSSEREPADLLADLERAGAALVATRPTAVNIGWAVGRMLAAAREELERGAEARALTERLVAEALTIRDEDEAACAAIGAFGSELVPDDANVLTHCNTGMLCTGGIGTAQGVIHAAHRAGKRVHVWVDETRPLWQGARLTAWELGKLGIPRTLVADGAAGSLMASGKVDLVITGADRIAADGSAANKVGTYPLAVLAARHGIPFVIAAPTSTIDLATPTGDLIRIEERDPSEVTSPFGRPVAAADTPALNPAFDVTPPDLVEAIVTERGVLRKPYPSRLREAVKGAEGT